MGVGLKPLESRDPPLVGPYRLLAVLGSGGMGRVYLGRSPGARAVAVKVIRPDLCGDQRFLVRFRREVEAAGAVGGVFTSPVVDAHMTGPTPWLATSYVAGPALDEAVRAYGPLAEPGARALGAALAEALVGIHGAGVVHRDLKPANVLLAEDGPKVIDFGISRAPDGTSITRSGALIGTAAYMSPEQAASGRRVGPATDVFALGGILVYATTGAPPFGTGSVPAVLDRVMHGRPRLEGVPGALLGVVAACLDKDPARRPSPAALVERLAGARPAEWWPPPIRQEISARAHEVAALLAGSPSRTSEPPRDVQPTRADPPEHGRRRVLGMTAAGVGAITAAGVTAWFTRDGHHPQPRSVRAGVVGTPQGPRPLWIYVPDVLSSLKLPTAVAPDALVLGESSRLCCLDTATGARRWTTPDPSGFDSVDVAGNIVYAANQRQELAACDLDRGRHRWVITPPGTGPFELEGVAKSIMYSTTLGGSPPSLYAVDLPSARERWRYRPPSASSPFSVVLVAGRCLVVTDDMVYALDALSGRPAWQAPYDRGFQAVAASETTVFMRTSDAVTALAGGAGARLWTTGGFGGRWPTVLTVAGGVVCVGDENVVSGLDASTGRIRWRTRLTGPPSVTAPQPRARSFVAIPLAPGAQATAGFAALNLADGRIRWTYRVPNDTRTQWDLHADETRVYAFDGRRLLAFQG
ncbi:PQQ-binding-like beta-propeller repeat protein [Actinoallomurus sp. NPDC050550]|uniref:protein kinase domain-containing protein n=1 Tax=Actinoallomurus sp. NPDC050550 TaxID=3154937 RepID=UPI0033DE17B6